MAELELAKLLSELMTVEQADAIISSDYARIRARLLNLPGKIAGEGEMKPREELLTLVERLVYEALEELAAGQDVPHTLEATPARRRGSNT